MFRVGFTNFGYYSQEEFSSAFDALEYAKEKCFEATVDFSRGHNLDSIPVVSYSPLRGVNWWKGLSSLSQITPKYAAFLLGIKEEDLHFDLSKPIVLMDVRRHWLMLKEGEE